MRFHNFLINFDALLIIKKAQFETRKIKWQDKLCVCFNSVITVKSLKVNIVLKTKGCSKDFNPLNVKNDHTVKCDI